MAPPIDGVSEKDKPFFLTVAVVGSWIGAVLWASFVLKDLETAKFIAATFGAAAGMGLAFYLSNGRKNGKSGNGAIPPQ